MNDFDLKKYLIENKEANERLGSQLRAKGLGFFKLEGHWQECQDKSVNYFDCPRGRYAMLSDFLHHPA